MGQPENDLPGAKWVEVIAPNQMRFWYIPTPENVYVPLEQMMLVDPLAAIVVVSEAERLVWCGGEVGAPMEALIEMAPKEHKDALRDHEAKIIECGRQKLAEIAEANQ